MTIGQVYRNIKNWVHGKDYRKWLFCYLLNQEAHLSVDHQGDLCSTNEPVFDAYTDKKLLLKTLAWAKQVLIDESDDPYGEYANRYLEVRG